MADKLENLYNVLSSSNAIDNLPDYGTFKTGLQDPAKAKNFFNALKDNNIVKGLPSDYNFFAIPLGLPTSLPKPPAADYRQGLIGGANAFETDISGISKRPLDQTTVPLPPLAPEKEEKPFSFENLEFMRLGLDPSKADSVQAPMGMPIQEMVKDRAAKREEQLLSMPQPDFEKTTDADRDVITNYYKGLESSAENSFKAQNAKAPTVAPSIQSSKLGTPAPQFTGTMAYRDLQKAQNKALNELNAKYQDITIARNSDLLKEDFGKDPQLTNPKRLKEHLFDMGNAVNYALYPEQQKLRKKALGTDVIDFESRTGLDVSTGASKGDKMISPVEVGKLIVDGASVELNLTKRAIENSDKTITQINNEVNRLTNRLAEINDDFEKEPRLKEIPQNKAIYDKLNGAIDELNTKLVDAKDRRQTLQTYQTSVNSLIDREAKPYKELQQQTQQFDMDYLIRSIGGGAGSAMNLGRDLLEFGLNTLYGAGQMAQATKVRFSDAAPIDKGVYGIYSKSYTNDLRYHLGLPDEESYQKRSEFASVNPRTDEIEYNWASLPFQIVKTYVESMAMGKPAAMFGKMAEGSSAVRALAASGRLGALGARGATWSSQLAGMTLGTEVMFGHQMLMQELDKGTDFDTAWNITQVRNLIEASSEMLNPLEINLAGGRSVRYLDDLTVDQAETALLRAGKAREWSFNTFGTHKWDNAVDFLYRTGNAVKRGGWSTLDNAFKEYLEEFMANIANWAYDKKLAVDNPKYRQDNEMSLRNEYLTAVNTVVGMGIMLGQGAYAKHKGVINSANYLVGTNPQVYLDRLEEDYKKGLIDQSNYEIQKGKITQQKEIGDLSKPDLDRIDSSQAGETDKSNAKFIVYQNNQEIIQKTEELASALKTGKAESIGKLREEIVSRAESNGDIVDEMEAIEPLPSVSDWKEGMRERRINRFLTKNVSLFRIQQIDSPEILTKYKEEIGKAISKEMEQHKPNDKIIKRYDGIIEAVDQRLNFLQGNPEQAKVEEAPDTTISVDSVAKKFTTPDAQLTEEEMAFAEANEEAIATKVDELKGVTEDVNEGEDFFAGMSPEDRADLEGRMGWSEEDRQSMMAEQDGKVADIERRRAEELAKNERDYPADHPQYDPSDHYMADQATNEKYDAELEAIGEKEQRQLGKVADEIYQEPSEKPKDITEENENILRLPELNIQGNIALIGDKLVSAFNATATLVREYGERIFTEANYRQLFPLTNELVEKYAALQSKDLYQPGTKVRLVVRATEYPDFLEESKDQFSGLTETDPFGIRKYMNPKDIEDDDYFVPIEILDEKGNSIGFIHTIAYINPDRVVATLDEGSDKQDNLEDNYNQLKKLRKEILRLAADGDVNTIINGKTAGHLSLDMNKENYRPIRDRFRNRQVLRTLKVNKGTPEIIDGREVKNNIAAGRAVVVLPTPDDRRVAVGLRRSKIPEEVAKSIRHAIELYLTRGSNQRAIAAVIDELGRDYDLATIDGLNNYMSLFVYTGTRRKDMTNNRDIRQKYATRPFIDFDKTDETIWFSKQRVFQPDTPENVYKLREGFRTIDDQLRPLGVARIKLGADFNVAKVLDHLEATMMAMNLNVREDLMSGNTKFSAPILAEEEGKIIINSDPTFANSGTNYLDFLSNHLSSNILEHEITRPDGKKEFVYFEQATISIDPALDTYNQRTPAKKPRAKKGYTVGTTKIKYKGDDAITSVRYVRGKKKGTLKEIRLGEAALRKQFDEKAWTKEGLDAALFQTPAEWTDFLVSVELQKEVTPRDTGETAEAYTERLRNEVITDQDIKPQVEATPETVEEKKPELGSLSDLTDEDLDINEDLTTFELPSVRTEITQEDVDEVKKICK